MKWCRFLDLPPNIQRWAKEKGLDQLSTLGVRGGYSMNKTTFEFLFFLACMTGIFAFFLIAPVVTVIVLAVFIPMIMLRRCIQ